jgi:hypothetical protein
VPRQEKNRAMSRPIRDAMRVTGSEPGVASRLWILPALGLLVVLFYSVAEGSWKVFAIAFAVGLAALASGGLVGFLFGIPRTLTSEAAVVGGAQPGSGTTVPTNLEQISDWLTKIIVGVGLVELGSIRSSLGQLVDYLAAALDTGASAKPFTLALITYFAISGFIAGYIITRIVLQQEFAVAERDIATIAGRVVTEVVERRDEADAEALRLLVQQLDGREASVDQEELNAAVASATQVTKQVIFTRARRQRQESWKGNKPQVERTIPVFRALIAADTEKKYHRNHAQLAYALKDQPTPDWAAAESALGEAIKIRDQLSVKGYQVYEFNRAQCRINRDVDFAKGQPSTPEQRQRIEEDIAVVLKSRVARTMRADPTVTQWAELQTPPVDLTAT